MVGSAQGNLLAAVNEDSCLPWDTLCCHIMARGPTRPGLVTGAASEQQDACRTPGPTPGLAWGLAQWARTWIRQHVQDEPSPPRVHILARKKDSPCSPLVPLITNNQTNTSTCTALLPTGLTAPERTLSPHPSHTSSTVWRVLRRRGKILVQPWETLVLPAGTACFLAHLWMPYCQALPSFIETALQDMHLFWGRESHHSGTHNSPQHSQPCGCGLPDNHSVNAFWDSSPKRNTPSLHEEAKQNQPACITQAAPGGRIKGEPDAGRALQNYTHRSICRRSCSPLPLLTAPVLMVHHSGVCSQGALHICWTKVKLDTAERWFISPGNSTAGEPPPCCRSKHMLFFTFSRILPLQPL